mmetsp:Transcript_9922/g.14937  ORF Transcript_9922/g.14937 Transcript_9922/m.14937 type:complete len:1022 (+) Transcript_9922:532-3597(+)
MNITETDVQEEKYVISSEYLAKQGLGERLLAKYWKAIFDDTDSTSLLANRMPIGIPSVFMNTDSTALRTFYEKWYRPENMAVVVVGACTGRVREVEDIITTAFQQCELTQQAHSSDVYTFTDRVINLQAAHLTLPSHHSNDVVVLMRDKELTSAQVSYEFFSPVQLGCKEEFFRSNILHRLMTSVVDSRMNELVKRRGNVPSDAVVLPSGESPFLSFGISVREFVRGLLCVGVTAVLKLQSKGLGSSSGSGSDSDSEECKKDVHVRDEGSVTETDVATALRAMMVEMRRLKDHGLHLSELDAAKKKWRQMFVDQRDRNTATSSALCADLTDHILCGGQTPFATPQEEASLCIECLEGVTVDEMKVFISQVLDMHLPEPESTYYIKPQSFRVLSVQLPFCTAAGSDDTDPCHFAKDSDLRKALLHAREEVQAIDTMEPWPSHDRMHEEDIIAAARRALEDSGAPKNTSNGSSLVQPTKCQCCENAFSFLPHSLLRSIEKEQTPPDESKVENIFVSQTVSDQSVKGVSMAVNSIDSIGSTEFKLPNGVTVCVKWMPKESPGKISFQGFALGGSTELTESEDAVMAMLDNIACQSPTVVGKEPESAIVIRAKDMADIQSENNTRVNTQRHYNHRGLGGSCPCDHFELLLSMLVLKLTSQRLDREAYDDLISRQRSHLCYRDNSPEHTFMDRARVLTCGDVPISRPLTEEVLAGASFEMAELLYARAFLADPTEFTLVFVGDLPPMSEVQNMLLRYISPLCPLPEECLNEIGGRWCASKGSCEVRKEQEYPYTRVGHSHRIDKAIHETIRLRQAEKASLLIAFRADMTPLHLADAEDCLLSETILIDAACRALQSALLDELRINMGKVYSVVVDSSRGALATFSLISIGMHCDPVDLPEVQATVERKLTELRAAGPDAGTLHGIVEAMLSKQKQGITCPSHWLFWILDSYKTYKVHEWKTTRNARQSVSRCSSKWVQTYAHKRSIGKAAHIKEILSTETVRDVYLRYFDITKSVHLNLCPCDPIL